MNGKTANRKKNYFRQKYFTRATDESIILQKNYAYPLIEFYKLANYTQHVYIFVMVVFIAKILVRWKSLAVFRRSYPISSEDKCVGRHIGSYCYIVNCREATGWTLMNVLQRLRIGSCKQTSLKVALTRKWSFQRRVYDPLSISYNSNYFLLRFTYFLL